MKTKCKFLFTLPLFLSITLNMAEAESSNDFEAPEIIEASMSVAPPEASPWYTAMFGIQPLSEAEKQTFNETKAVLEQEQAKREYVETWNQENLNLVSMQSSEDLKRLVMSKGNKMVMSRVNRAYKNYRDQSSTFSSIIGDSGFGTSGPVKDIKRLKVGEYGVEVRTRPFKGQLLMAVLNPFVSVNVTHLAFQQKTQVKLAREITSIGVTSQLAYELGNGQKFWQASVSKALTDHISTQVSMIQGGENKLHESRAELSYSTSF